MSQIFISYSRQDIEFAQRIVEFLGTNKLDAWIDWKSIPKGEDWEQEIYRGIEEADAFLFLISPYSVASEMCNKEILHAVKNGKRILPIFITTTEVEAVKTGFRHEKQRDEILTCPPKTDPTYELGLVKGDRQKWRKSISRRSRSSASCGKRRF